MLKYCVSHKPLLFKNNIDIKHILLGDEILSQRASFAPSEFVHHVSEIATDLDFLHNVLAGSSGTFAISRLLQNSQNDWDETTSLAISQYRKFMSNEIFGISSKNYPGMIMVPISDSKALDVSEIQGNISTPFLMPMPIVVGSIYKQYCASHRGADLLRYSALAVELDIIKQSEVLDFFNSDLMIPGGVEFGIYPVAIFVNIVSKLEEICLQFSRGNQPAALDRYQRRALAFCNERMGSYLLLKSLEQICGANIPKEWFGHMHTISDNLTYYGT